MLPRVTRVALLGFLALLIATPVLPAAVALVRPPLGFHPDLLGKGLLTEPIHLRRDDASDVYVHRVTIDPGGSSGWHTHPGRLVLTVDGGTLTMTEDHDGRCEKRTVLPGMAILEPVGIHEARNDGVVPLVLHTTAVIPAGSVLFLPAATPVRCP